ncbi:hypothetical protein F6A46_06300 [Tenacibaculum finnmarkense genomovar ulcerans]|uniref:hypothetical protein n=1 Tax=Tenacibaculum finnmarkense TaxID=2781243 RepID=UPI00187B457D|nr:hypothetical protein [Tenacibaculum finnmarkense]MBE7687845.1 hypothetical protein [Tenacibaculum finnmarkense genomovar ulcerans]
MIDYVKIELQNINVKLFLKRILDLNYLDVIGGFNHSVSEILKEKEVIKHHFCTITIFPSGRIVFAGSIHKFYNSLKGIIAPNHLRILDKIKLMPSNTPAEQKKKNEALAMATKKYKGFNGNDFTLFQIVEVRKYLELLLDCEPEQMKFLNIEFGYNLQLDFKCNLFLKGLLMYQGSKVLNPLRTAYKFVFDAYELKYYDKGKQYKMVGNILRVELKYSESRFFKKFGIETFSDVNANTLTTATERLIFHLDKTLYYDYTIDTTLLKPLNVRKSLQFRDVNYWLKVKPNHRNRQKQVLKEFIYFYSNNLKNEVKKAIIKKQKCVILRQYLEPKNSIKKQLPKKQKCVILRTSSKARNISHKQSRICLITGVNISMQKEDSFLLSHTGLKHLIKTDFTRFEKIRNKYIYPKYRFSDIAIQIKEVAHAIRDKNIIRNNNNNPNQTSMFYN